MLPDLSAWHVMIVLVVALVVVGPQDLPKLLHKIGKFVGKMRGMANEFRSSFDEMARQSELEDLRKEVEAMRKASHAAIPQDLGIAAQMQSDSEAAYLANWEASHAPSTDAAAAVEPAPVMTAKPKAAAKPRAAAPKASAPTPAASKAAPKRAAAKTDVATAAPKPRVKKAKPEADA